MTTYLTSTAADTLLAARLPVASWVAADDSTKDQALAMASSVIDSLNYAGVTQSSSQVNKFPRKYLINPYDKNPWSHKAMLDVFGYYSESSAVPGAVLLACALEAAALIDNMSGMDEQDLIASGVTSFGLGKLSMTFAANRAAMRGFKSPEAFRLLEPYTQSAYLVR